MAKAKAKAKDAAAKGKAGAATAAGDRGTSGSSKALSAAKYVRELRKLHVELVKLQEWVVHKGLKLCVVFEGRDGAGKGGTIKAITERVSRGCSASSHCPRRPSARSPRCTRSATCRSFRLPARS